MGHSACLLHGVIRWQRIVTSQAFHLYAVWVACCWDDKLIRNSSVSVYIGWSDVYGHDTIAICGYNTTWCAALNGENLSCYSKKLNHVSLRKCPWLTNKAYLTAITVTNTTKSFTYKMAAKIDWHRYMEQNYVTVTLCIMSKSNEHMRILASCTTKVAFYYRYLLLNVVVCVWSWKSAFVRFRFLLAFYTAHIWLNGQQLLSRWRGATRSTLILPLHLPLGTSDFWSKF